MPTRATIGRLTTAAVDCAPDSGYGVPDAGPPHRVAKLYYLAGPWAKTAVVVGLGSDGHGAVRESGELGTEGGRGRGAVTAQLDTAAYWQQVSWVVACHQTQLADARALGRLRPEEHRRLWGVQQFHRAGSAAEDGRMVEEDLFAGLR